MRDIRPDLRERLAAVRRLLDQIGPLEQERDALENMLALEETRWKAMDDSASAAPTNGHAAVEPAVTALSSMLREQLADGKRHHLKQLSEEAVKRGFPFGNKKPGRVVHFALLGMETSGKSVERLGDGYWKLTSQ